MHYWIRVNGKIWGPMPTEEIALLPGVGPKTLICPKNRPSKKRKNWRFARSFPKVRAALAGIRAPARKPPREAIRAPARKPLRKAEGKRFFARIRGKLCGPLDPGNLSTLPKFGPRTLVCQEGRDPNKYRNWRFARSFSILLPVLKEAQNRPSLRDRLKPFLQEKPAAAKAALPPEPAFDGFFWSTALGVITIAASFWFVSAPTIPVAQAQPESNAETPQQTGANALLDIYLPACQATLEEKLGGVKPTVQEKTEGRAVYTFLSADFAYGETLVFEYDDETRQVWPLSEMAKKLMDPRSACPNSG